MMTIIYENKIMRVETHVISDVKLIGFLLKHMTKRYKCTEKWSDGTPCDSVTIYGSLHTEFTCMRAFNKDTISGNSADFRAAAKNLCEADQLINTEIRRFMGWLAMEPQEVAGHPQVLAEGALPAPAGQALAEVREVGAEDQDHPLGAEVEASPSD